MQAWITYIFGFIFRSKQHKMVAYYRRECRCQNCARSIHFEVDKADKTIEKILCYPVRNIWLRAGTRKITIPPNVVIGSPLNAKQSSWTWNIFQKTSRIAESCGRKHFFQKIHMFEALLKFARKSLFAHSYKIVNLMHLFTFENFVSSQKASDGCIRTIYSILHRVRSVQEVFKGLYGLRCWNSSLFG